jgi:hypothetical protein
VPWRELALWPASVVSLHCGEKCSWSEEVSRGDSF